MSGKTKNPETTRKPGALKTVGDVRARLHTVPTNVFVRYQLNTEGGAVAMAGAVPGSVEDVLELLKGLDSNTPLTSAQLDIAKPKR